ncbi:hypothetical protein D3C71_1309430 [compost metagenome]
MITPAGLLELATNYESIYKARVAAGFGVGTYDKERNDARRNMELAEFCAAEMERAGITNAKAFGPFQEFKLVRGDKVRLKAGAKVRSTHPKYRGVGYINPKTRTVEIFDTHEGYANPNAHHRDPSLRHPEIVWVGTGGYWFYADFNDIEVM